jgi:nitrite reductase (cytochrome c-552)
MSEKIDKSPPSQEVLTVPKRLWRAIPIVVLLAIAAAAGLAALLVNIFEHKQEAKSPFYRVVELNDSVQDPAVWGKNFPIQYDGYKATVDLIRTRFGGSEAVPRTPTSADPRSVVAQSKLEEDPRLKAIWAGYAFAKDFREERGHAYMLDDQTYTERQIAAKQPGTCLHCHASIYVPYKKLGDGDLMRGFEKMNQMPFAEARKLVEHAVACIDCHDPETMALRVTRPGFLEGIRALKASQGVADYDVNKQATRQEMRSYVCGQCHVEYYFKGTEKRLVYPRQGPRRGDGAHRRHRPGESGGGGRPGSSQTPASSTANANSLLISSRPRTRWGFTRRRSRCASSRRRSISAGRGSSRPASSRFKAIVRRLLRRGR